MVNIMGGVDTPNGIVFTDGNLHSFSISLTPVVSAPVVDILVSVYSPDRRLGGTRNIGKSSRKLFPSRSAPPENFVVRVYATS
jgi:hypothetical protein